MTLFILVEGPMHTSGQQARAWLTAEAGKLLAASEIESVSITPLASPSREHPRAWNWSIEIELRPGCDVPDAADGQALSELLHELRSLHMHPMVALADPAERRTFSRTET